MIIALIFFLCCFCFFVAGYVLCALFGRQREGDLEAEITLLRHNKENIASDCVEIIDDKKKHWGYGLIVDKSKNTLYGIGFADGQVLYYPKSWCHKSKAIQHIDRKSASAGTKKEKNEKP